MMCWMCGSHGGSGFLETVMIGLTANELVTMSTQALGNLLLSCLAPVLPLLIP